MLHPNKGEPPIFSLEKNGHHNNIGDKAKTKWDIENRKDGQVAKVS